MGASASVNVPEGVPEADIAPGWYMGRGGALEYHGVPVAAKDEPELAPFFG